MLLVRNWGYRQARMFAECHHPAAQTTEWERNFLKELRSTLEHRQPVSNEQLDILEGIFKRVEVRGVRA